MAQLTTYTSTTDLTEIIETERIHRFIASYQYPEEVGIRIAWSVPGKGSTAEKFPRWNALISGVPSGTKAESDTFADRDIDTTEGSITPGLVGFRIPIPDEVMAMAMMGVPASLLAECMNALADRIDEDILALSPTVGATNTTGADTDSFTLAKFRSALAAYKALNIRGGMGTALVLGATAAGQLLESMHTSAATMVLGGGDTLSLGPSAGYLGTVNRIAVYESANVPTDGAGHSHLMTQVGPQASALGLVVSELPRVEISRGDDATVRAVTYFVCRAWYGVGVANVTKGMEILAA